MSEREIRSTVEAAMATNKHPEAGPRRVWRMTADAPSGEYLDLVPKEAPASNPAASKRPVPLEAPPAHKIVSPGSGQAASTAEKASQPRAALPASQKRLATEELLADVMSAAAKVKVLRPAQVESWQASSFDLMTGCKVRDVTDTIPGNVFDELFNPSQTDFFHPGPVRRRR